VILLDLTLPMLHVARRAAARRGLVPLGFLVVDAETLPLIDHSVSLVTYRIAPHHFADVTAFVGEVARVLVPGGHVLLIDSLSPADRELDEQVNELERRRDPSHVRGGNGEAASRASLRGVGTRWTACGCGTERGRGSGTLAVHGVSLQRSVARAAGV
jgi:ubiquinone/menaquinone biosynthesis C-methylase UbiE